MKTKKIISMLTTVITLILTLCIGVNAKTLKGDINADGKVTAEDARLALRAAVGLEDLTSDKRTLADCDGDGYVTAADARTILRTAVGITDFNSILFEVARSYYYPDKGYGASKNEFKDAIGLESIYRLSGKWCCFYTVHDVFRPALEKAGYSAQKIEEIAPIYFSSEKVAKAASVVVKEALETENVSLSKFWFSSSNPVYIPSLLMDYYRSTTGKTNTFYTFYNYYDDMITNAYYQKDTDDSGYYPKVGDVVFMSNKSRTYVNNMPTVDHTAQIIQVYADGTFLCTEGSIIIDDVPDGLPRVRERVYRYDSTIGTYVYNKNTIVRVLAVARPNL